MPAITSAPISGTFPLANAGDGITLYGVANNQIGGLEPGAGNVISGNSNRGIAIANEGASNNVALGNLIGTDLTGTLAVPNSTGGVAIVDAPANVIGGPSSAARNVISGNKQTGLIITGAASANWVQGNYIGLDITGAKRLANTGTGMQVESVGNVIGGAAAGAGNVISGNGQNGVFLTAESGNCSVSGNTIGTDFTGTTRLGNALTGVRIESSANLVGGQDTLARNLISGNTNSGIYVYGAAASNNVVQGNYIGVDFSGSLALGNGYAGISISNAPANTIGGPAPGAGNIISANSLDGLSLAGKTATATTIQGNYLGTDVSGSKPLGNGLSGIYLFGASANWIGGTAAGAGNVISANRQDGIFATSSGAISNVIQGNFVGLAADGAGALGNAQHGIEFDSTASGNLVGGSAPAADNRIAFSGAGNTGYDGIRVRDGCVGNFISRNCIYSNGNSTVNGLGIDTGVDGVSTNGLPVIASATSGSQTVVQGTLKAGANLTFLLQFYANTALPASGYGEGLAFVGSQSVTTDSKGNASFSATLPTPVTAGQFVTATATDPAKNTSEFSKAVLVTGVPMLSLARNPAPALKSLRAGSSLPSGLSYTLFWPASLTGYTLFETTNLTPPVRWQRATNLPSLVGGINQISISVTNGDSRFYQLQQQ